MGEKFPVQLVISWQRWSGRYQRWVVIAKNKNGLLLDHREINAYQMSRRMVPTVVFSLVFDEDSGPDARFEVDVGKESIRMFMIDGRFGRNDRPEDGSTAKRWPKPEWILFQVPLAENALRQFQFDKDLSYAPDGLPARWYGSALEEVPAFQWTMRSHQELRPLVPARVEQIGQQRSQGKTVVLVSFDLGQDWPYHGERKSWVGVKIDENNTLRNGENVYLVFDDFGQIERFWKSDELEQDEQQEGETKSPP